MTTQTETLVVKLDADISRFDKKINQVDDSVNKLTKTTKKSGQGMANFSRRSGMAGIQFQQFIGQIQGGQSAMVALSQQSADLGFVLGAPLLGAVAGISASIVGMLLPALFSTKDAMSLLDEVAVDLKKSLSSTSTGVIELSSNLLKLAEKSEALARLQISTSIFDAEKQIKIASTGIKDHLEDAFGGNALNVLNGFSENMRNAAMRTNQSMDDILKSVAGGSTSGLAFGSSKIPDTIRIMADNLKITKVQAAELAVSISDVFSEQSIFNVKKLENSIADLNTETGGSNEKIADFAKNLIPLFDATSNGVDKVNALRIAYANLNKTIEKQKNPVSDIEDPTDEQIQQAKDLSTALAIGREQANAERLQSEKDFIARVDELKATGIETDEERFIRQIEIHKAMLDAKLISEKEFAAAQAVLAKGFAKTQKVEVKETKQSEVEKLNSRQAALRAGMAINTAFFNDNKGVAAGLIVADTATGIQKSLAINPYDYGNVALIAATGAANLANALGASKGGGSISGGGSGSTQSFEPPQQEQELSTLDITAQDESNVIRHEVVLTTEQGDAFLEFTMSGIEEATRRGA